MMILDITELLLSVTVLTFSDAFILDTSMKGACYDTVSSCASLGREVCTREHEQFARMYCPKHCGFCDPSHNTANHWCVYKNVSYPDGGTWEDGCDYKCRCEDAATNFFVCTDYCPKPETGDDPDGCYWTKVPFQCCEVQLCPNPTNPTSVSLPGETSRR